MRHANHNRKFGRPANQRRAFLRGLAHNLIIEGKIKTTEPRAKELRPFIEKLITTAKPKTLTARRLVASRLGNEPIALKELVDTIAPRYATRAGGYTRITKLGRRTSDGSPMAIIEFVQ